MKRAVAILLLIFAAESADALTVRSKGDLRMWQTVFDRSTPIVWDWESAADAATVTLSNCLTGAVSSQTVGREPAATRGSLPQPVISVTDEVLLNVTVVQTTNGVEVSRVAADLAYVPGTARQPIVVRTKARRDWYRVPMPCFAAFDAAWWDVAGTSGYEVLWREPAGPHCVEREFDGVGVVDEVTLKFGMPGFLLMLR